MEHFFISVWGFPDGIWCKLINIQAIQGRNGHYVGKNQ